MKYFKIIWFGIMIAIGVYLGPLIAAQIKSPISSLIRISNPIKSRMGMQLAKDNAGGPGKLVINGLLVLGGPEKVSTKPHRMIIKLRIIAEDGTVIIEKKINNFTINGKDHDIEYPIHQTYHLPTGFYQVQLQGWDSNRLIKNEYDEFIPLVHRNTWYLVQ